MSKSAAGGAAPTPKRSVSLSGKPKAFSHVKSNRAEFNKAATGNREKQAMRSKAPELKKSFRRAHEGPREKIAKPRTQLVPRPCGNVVQQVHTKHDNEARLRNRQKDQQMKKWRERTVSSARTNSKQRMPAVQHRKRAPDVRATEARKQAFKRRLQQKRGRSIDSQSL